MYKSEPNLYNLEQTEKNHVILRALQLLWLLSIFSKIKYEVFFKLIKMKKILEILAPVSDKLACFLKNKSRPNLYNLEQTEKRPCD